MHRQRVRAGACRHDHDLVFASGTGTGIDAAEWTPRELRHSFLPLLSDSGMTVDQIARLVGHAGGSPVTELVYRKQIRPVIDDGATAMNDLFPEEQR